MPMIGSGIATLFIMGAMLSYHLSRSLVTRMTLASGYSSRSSVMKDSPGASEMATKPAVASRRCFIMTGLLSVLSRSWHHRRGYAAVK